MTKFTKKSFAVITALVMASVLSACGSSSDSDAPAGASSAALSINPVYGEAAALAVFGGTAGVTNQGKKTVIHGDFAAACTSTMITGFHSSTAVYTETPSNLGAVTGLVFTYPPEGSAADQAKADAMLTDITALYASISADVGGTVIAADQLGGKTVTPGVYKADSGAYLLTGGDLTLDAQGNPNAVWVFQMASSLTVGDTAPRSVILINGAQSKNVYWAVGSAATINGIGGGTMVGTIVSNTGGITFSTDGNTDLTTLNGRALSRVASVTMVNTIINSSNFYPAGLVADANRLHVQVSGINAGDVTPILTGDGYITISNDGAHVAATLDGLGKINISNKGTGKVIAATLTGDGEINIVTSLADGAVNATSTGSSKVFINSSSSGAVSVTNTGTGNVYVKASLDTVLNIVTNSAVDVYFDNSATPLTAGTLAALEIAKVKITGINSVDVAPVITGTGFITVINDGGHVAATLTGAGLMSVINNSVGNAVAATLTGDGSMTIVNNGGILDATNTGNGSMSVNSTCTGAVSVTNTGNGKVIVYASGTDAITIIHNGDEDYTYGTPGSFPAGLMTPAQISRISVSGSNPTGVIPTLTGLGFINVVNNGAGVNVTETGTGTIDIFNMGTAAVSVTNNSSGLFTVWNAGSGALTITNTVAGNGSIVVKVPVTSSGPVTVTNNNSGAITLNSNASGAVVVTNNTAFHITVNATGLGGTVDFNGTADAIITLP